MPIFNFAGVIINYRRKIIIQMPVGAIANIIFPSDLWELQKCFLILGTIFAYLRKY